MKEAGRSGADNEFRGTRPLFGAYRQHRNNSRFCEGQCGVGADAARGTCNKGDASRGWLLNGRHCVILRIEKQQLAAAALRTDCLQGAVKTR
jgi:hypothetical protein